MDKKGSVEERSMDFTRESLIALSYASPKSRAGAKVAHPHSRDVVEKYRSKLISLYSSPTPEGSESTISRAWGA